jgi:hypothetical protein
MKLPIVYRIRQGIGGHGSTEVETQFDINLKALAQLTLGRMHPMAPPKHHIVQDDFIL